MPRKTRAATKAANDEIHNDETATQTPEQTELQSTLDERPPLAEIAANEVEQLTQEISVEDKPPAKEKYNTKRKNTRKGTKGKKLNTAKAKNIIDREIGELALQVVEAPQCLTPSTQKSENSSEICVENSTPSPVLTQSVSEDSKENTPPIQGDVQSRSLSEVSVAEKSKEDHVILDLGASQAGQKLEELFQPQEGMQEILKEPSIAEILARSASKKSRGLQDPIDAMDADEERLEEVGNALSALKGKGMAARAAVKDKVKSKPSTTAKKLAPVSHNKKLSSPGAQSDDKSTSPTARLPSTRVGSPKTSPVTQAKPTIAALHTPVKVVKSTKPPTKSTFQLPGEAIAAKLKAQREERQKKKEAEASNTLSRPKSTLLANQVKPVEVRQTAASRARMTMLKGTVSAKPLADGRERTSPSGTKRISTVPTKSALFERLSTLPHRPKPVIPESPVVKGTHTANTGRPRATIVNQSVKPGQRKTNAGETMKSNESKLTQKQPVRDFLKRNSAETATQRGARRGEATLKAKITAQ